MKGCAFKKSAALLLCRAAIFKKCAALPAQPFLFFPLVVVWCVRNEAVWNAIVKSPACVFARIKRDVICRINAHLPVRLSSDDRSWWDSLCNVL